MFYMPYILNVGSATSFKKKKKKKKEKVFIQKLTNFRTSNIG